MTDIFDSISEQPIEAFRPQQQNANKHSSRGEQMLEDSMGQVGWIGAMTVAADNEAFDGSSRLEKAASVFDGVAPIVVDSDGTRPVIVRRTDIASADSPIARKASVLANRVAEVSLSWDTEVLEQWNEAGDIEIDAMWFPEEMAGWELPDYDAPTDEEDEETTENLIKQAESGGIEPRCKEGEIWALGRHRIACGDSTDEGSIRKLLGDKFDDVGMVFADPPYGISIVATNGYVGGGEVNKIPFGGVKNETPEEKQKRLGTVGGSKPFGTVGGGNPIPATKYAPIIGDDTIETAVASSSVALTLFPDSVHVWWGGNYYAQSLPNSSCWIIWDKENTGNFADAEVAWTNSPTAIRIFKHMWNGLMKASERGQSRVHPTQKPIALCEWTFEKYGKPDDVIFDPFLGSAPSIIAAEKMDGDRTVYGFELSPDYCEVVMRRWEEYTGGTAQLAGHL